MADSSRTAAPTTIDLSLSDTELRPLIIEALNSLSPMLEIINHGCESKCRSLAAAVKKGIRHDDGSIPPQQAHELDNEVLAPPLKHCLRGVCLRVLRIVLNEPSLAQSLAAQNLDVQGRLCLREYPPAASPDAPPQRLGAHCDSTLMTLLWADGPGLEVLDPIKAADWAPKDILLYGLPTMGAIGDEPVELRDDQWARVELDWSRDPLLLTIGTSWLTNELVSSRAPAKCAVLHRVVLPSGGAKARHSLPFLVDIVEATTAAPSAEEAAPVEISDSSSSTPPLPPAFAALAEALPPPVRALLVENAPPSSVPFRALLESLGLEEQYKEHTYSDLRSLRLLRLARGLPAEPPRTHATSEDVLRRKGALSSFACLALRRLVDDDAKRSVAADSVDGAPDHQVDLSGSGALAELVGAAEASRLWELAAAFRRQCEGICDDDDKDAAEEPSELFVRRYTPESRPWIPFHCDRARCTVNVSLGDDAAHVGGRLLALVDGAATEILRSEGEATVHSSRLCHAVSRMREGTRHSLIAFFA